MNLTKLQGLSGLPVAECWVADDDEFMSEYGAISSAPAVFHLWDEEFKARSCITEYEPEPVMLFSPAFVRDYPCCVSFADGCATLHFANGTFVYRMYRARWKDDPGNAGRCEEMFLGVWPD